MPSTLQSTLFSGDALLQQIAADVGGARISTSQNRHAPAVKKVQEALLLWDPNCLPTFGADGDYGNETAAAVHRFKRDVLLTPQPIHDDVGPQTVLRLDGLAFGNETTPFTILSVRLFAEDFMTELDPNEHAIGLNVLDNLVVEVRGTSYRKSAPATVALVVASASPNATGHAASVPPKSFSVPVINIPADTLAPVESTYQIVIPLAGFEPFTPPASRTVTTVVRKDEPAFLGDPHTIGPATSDARFREGLGTFIGRGFAKQTRAQHAGTTYLLPDGDLNVDRPDSLLLAKTAGAEILSFASGLVTVKVLLRRPADVFYYSGHGLDNGCLGVANTTNGSYTCWALPKDFKDNWPASIATRVLIIAGCSVLNIDTSTSPPTGIGMQWVPLLKFKGGPLDALLGYRGLAPSDAKGGNDIAKEFAAQLALGTNPVDAWLNINENHHAWNAVAISGTGQYNKFETTGLIYHHRSSFNIP